MFRINCSEFNKLLGEYREPTTKEDQLIQHKLYSIVDLYGKSGLEERGFSDEIMYEFCRIIELLKKQHKKETDDMAQKIEYLEFAQESANSAYMPLQSDELEFVYKTDYEVLSNFYDHYKRKEDGQLSYSEIDSFVFESEEQRRKLVNLTMWDYCNRIKTFAKKYLSEIYPFIEHESCEPIVFVYNNLELILAKIKTTNEKGETVKQRLNIRSALRKLNEFKQEIEPDWFENVEI